MTTKSNSEVSIVEIERVNLVKPLIISGFVGAGLVGGIAATHIVEQLKMKEIAHIRSRHMPSAAVFIDGKLRYPFRIYSNTEGNLCVIVSEIPIRSEGINPIASKLLDWVEKKGATEFVVLEGVSVKKILKDRQSYCVAELEKRHECEKKGIKILSEGIIHGIAGGLLNECLTRKITGLALMTPTVKFMPDPEGAAILISTLNDLYDLKIKIDELSKSGDKIKQKLQEVSNDHQKMINAEEKRGSAEWLYT